MAQETRVNDGKSAAFAKMAPWQEKKTHVQKLSKRNKTMVLHF